jgi:hypothetical protein
MDAEISKILTKRDEYVRYTAQRGTQQMPIVDVRDDAFQADTMFYDLRGKKRAIFNAIETTSRFAFARAYNGANPTDKETVAFLQEIKDTHDIKHLSTDKGSEYTNKEVVKWCKNNNVSLYFFQTAETKEKAIIERFNLTLRQLLNYYTAGKGWDWKSALSDIVDFYNHRVHRTIKIAPVDVDDAERDRIRAEAIARSSAYKDKLREYEPGTKVLVWIGADPDKSAVELASENFMRKKGQRWTSKVFTVEEVKGNKVKLEGYEKRYSPRDLHIVSSEYKDYEKPRDEVEEDEKKTQKTARKVSHYGLREEAKRLKEHQPIEPLKPRAKPVFDTVRKTRAKSTPKVYIVEDINNHKIDEKGDLWLNTKYEGFPGYTYQPLKNFIFEKQIISPAYKYLMKNKLGKHIADDMEEAEDV